MDEVEGLSKEKDDLKSLSLISEHVQNWSKLEVYHIKRNLSFATRRLYAVRSIRCHTPPPQVKPRYILKPIVQRCFLMEEQGAWTKVRP